MRARTCAASLAHHLTGHEGSSAANSMHVVAPMSHAFAHVLAAFPVLALLSGTTVWRNDVARPMVLRTLATRPHPATKQSTAATPKATYDSQTISEDMVATLLQQAGGSGCMTDSMMRPWPRRHTPGGRNRCRVPVHDRDTGWTTVKPNLTYDSAAQTSQARCALSCKLKTWVVCHSSVAWCERLSICLLEVLEFTRPQWMFSMMERPMQLLNSLYARCVHCAELRCAKGQSRRGSVANLTAGECLHAPAGSFRQTQASQTYNGRQHMHDISSTATTVAVRRVSDDQSVHSVNDDQACAVWPPCDAILSP